MGGIRTPVRLGEPSNTVIALIDPEATKVALDNVIQVEGLDLLLHTMLISASRLENNIQSVTLFDDNGRHKVEGRFCVDASGEGDLAAFGGASIRYGNHGKVQEGTLAVRFGGIKPGSDISAKRWAEAIQQAKQSGNTILTKVNGLIVPMPVSGDLLTYIINPEYSALDSPSITKAHLNARKKPCPYYQP